jgi:adenosylcobinamide-GDP ribazoletransferase
VNGILLAIQFFTSIPVRKELPLGRKEVTAMYTALPFVGAAIGLIMYAVSILFLNGIDTGHMLAAVFVTLTGIVLTGGLHLDGWADTGDAFFSYRDREKRLEILEDPRLGAFGTMALVLLIIVKIALFNEIFIRGYGHLALFVAIPLVARAGMNVYFTSSRSAKEKGIAYFFKEKIQGKSVAGFSVGICLIVLVAVGMVLGSYSIPVVLFALIALSVLLFRNWSLKHFGGVTGDLSGAFIEGMEVVLWLGVLLLR